MWGALILFGSIVLAVAGYMRVNRNPAIRNAAPRAVVVTDHAPQIARSQPRSLPPRRKMRPSRMPATPWGALAYIATAYVAHVAFTLHDMRQAVTTAWQDVGAAHVPPATRTVAPVAAPQPASPTAPRADPQVDQIADDLAVFAESRAAVVTMDYVAPPAVEPESSSANQYGTSSEPVLAGTDTEPDDNDVCLLPIAQQIEIAKYLEQGWSANKIAQELGGARGPMLAGIGAVRRRRDAELARLKAVA